jgi:hypothetical protein
MYSPSDEPRLYPEARAVLEALRWIYCPSRLAIRSRCRRRKQSVDALRRDRGIKLAVASRTPTPRTAEVFMQKLGALAVPALTLFETYYKTASLAAVALQLAE